MKIDIYSHSSAFGGAESALFALIETLQPDHEIRFFLPKLKGELFNALKNKDIEIYKHKFTSCLPLAHRLIDENVFKEGQNSILSEYKIAPDLIICNTITLPHVILHANSLNIPCIIYAHEYINGDPDLTPNGCSPKYYLRQIENSAAHIICASEFVASQFEEKNTTVLYPFTNSNSSTKIHKKTPIKKTFKEWIAKLILATKKISNRKLLAIGNKSARKNFIFSLGIHKSLLMREVHQTLLIIGNSGTTTSSLKKNITKRKLGKTAFLVNELANPYYYNDGQPINLISSTIEPFGLTVVESLSRGIPVVASRCGGPEEILPEKYTYQNNDYDSCVRILERIWANYGEACNESIKIFDEFSKNNTTTIRRSRVSSAIQKSILAKDKKYNPQNFFTKSHTEILSLSKIINNISTGAASRNILVSTEKIKDLIRKEIKNPGSAIHEDIKKYDVVPFAHSKEIDNLYREGIGLGIELAAHHEDIGKRQMLNFIILGMKEFQTDSQDSLRILCLGDGLGLDSITLAASGFEVDYMDYDSSTMSECAKLNINEAKNTERHIEIKTINQVKSKYDCIVCLEVIEHVPDPESFMKFMSDSLNANGILFLSECFDGIEDRWPTHLYTNEKYAQSIFDISDKYFSLIDINTNPLMKPFVFKKRLHERDTSNMLKAPKNQIFAKHSAKLMK